VNEAPIEPIASLASSVAGSPGFVVNGLSPGLQRKVRSIHEALKREHNSVVCALGQVLLHAKRAGECLERLASVTPRSLAAKARREVCHSLGISERTGYLYLRVFKNWQEIVEATKGAGLDIETLSLSSGFADLGH
jgi:hypothetical protein